eukprot:275876_1
MGNWISSLNALLIKVESEQISLEHTSDTGTYKILLLGCGHVGKSTIWKQLIKLYGNGLLDFKNRSPVTDIHDSINEQMKCILYYIEERNGLDILNKSRQSAVDIMNSPRNINISSIKHDLQILWDDENIRQTFNNHNSIAISDVYNYFFDDLDRICKSEYFPTEQDILLCYIPTTGIRSTRFAINDNCTMEVFDTGGQRSERNKWVHCFESVHCMMFVVSVSHFDLMLYEEEDINGLHESLNLFRCLVNQRYFKRSQFALILNFMDTFEDKIENKNRSLSICFSDYNDYKLKTNYIGTDIVSNYLQSILPYINIPPLVVHLCLLYYNNETRQSLDFIIEKFKSLMPNNRVNNLHIYPTCCIDTNNVNEIFEDIANIVVSNVEHPAIKYRNHPNSVYMFEDIKVNGMSEIKILFSIIMFALIVLCIILIFVPYYALSYLELAISGVICIFSCTMAVVARESGAYAVAVYMSIMAIFNAIQVTLYQLERESQYHWNWVVYILFPIFWGFTFFILISFVTIYWYWLQSWFVFWFGIMFIVVGVSININISQSLWIIGICFILLSMTFPIIAFLYLKKK